jgi:lipopolysaccharide assembly outer membrane protein LptD (OstA)
VNRYRKQFRTFLFLSSILLAVHLYGQNAETAPADTSRQAPKSPKKRGLEGPVLYEARHIENRMEEKQTILTGKAKVTYQDMTLTASKITVDWDKKYMLAEGLPDSVWVKTENGDSVKTLQLAGLPEFSESGDVMRGEVMTYNFETRRGRVLRGRTKFEDAFYNGQTLKMLNNKTINVAGGSYTTCSLDSNPHFHFWSKQMRILVNDKFVAKPIVLYAGHIPVFALPFGLFPIKKGRHSGLLIPRYGESSLEGRYLRGIGYYWAPNDYWDIKPSLDFFEKSGFLFSTDLNYQVRYKLTGSISGSWTRKNFSIEGREERRWDLRVNHNQTLSPTATLTVSGNLVSSGNFYKELSSNREYRLQQQIYSNATLNKRFGGSWSTTVNLNQTRTLSTGEITESLPQISIRGGQTQIIPKSKSKKRASSEIHWFNQIYVSYNSNLLSRRSLSKSTTDGPLVEQKGKGWNHTFGLSSTQKLFGWLNMNPRVNYNETWYDRRTAYVLNHQTNKVESTQESGFFARRTYTLSTSFTTKVYGTFYPRFFLKDVVFRHVATTSVSYGFQPDFSGKQFGYYQTVSDTAGKISSNDRFQSTLLGFGSTPRYGSKALTFSLSNLFQMKIGEGEKAKRIDLFNYDLSTSYNWKVKDIKLSDLNTTFQANPMQNVGVNFNARYTFYRTDANGQKINRLFVDAVDWGNWKSVFKTRWMQMNSFNADLNFRLSGKAKEGGGEGEMGKTPAGGASETEPVGNLSGDRFDMGEPASDFSLPWNLSGSFSYSENRNNPSRIEKNIYSNLSLDFNLTKNWKVSYRTQIDLKLKKAVSQDFSLHRDLHCWEAQVLWTPTGYKSFYFRINIKSPMLKELKYEKRTGRTGLYGGF